MTTAPDIFLSYNREERAVASRYADAFAAAWNATTAEDAA